MRSNQFTSSASFAKPSARAGTRWQAPYSSRGAALASPHHGTAICKCLSRNAPIRPSPTPHQRTRSPWWESWWESHQFRAIRRHQRPMVVGAVTPRAGEHRPAVDLADAADEAVAGMSALLPTSVPSSRNEPASKSAASRCRASSLPCSCMRRASFSARPFRAHAAAPAPAARARAPSPHGFAHAHRFWKLRVSRIREASL